MLEDKDRIFKNLYNDLGSDLVSAKERGDWNNTKEICENFFNCGVNVITTGNHVWDQKDIMKYIETENRLLRPKNLFEPAPGKVFKYMIKKII